MTMSDERMPPITVSLNAFNASDLNAILCEGSMDNAVDSSGMPRNILGMKLKKECDIDTATRNGITERSALRSIGTKRFICNPGKTPVTIPDAIPRIISIK